MTKIIFEVTEEELERLDSIGIFNPDMTKEQYVKLDEVTEILSDVLCIPDFYSRNILESDVSEAYNKIISLERVEIERGGEE